MAQVNVERASALMQGYAARTGLTSESPNQRYLWTDAFAVCNYLELSRLTGKPSYAALALLLVDEVHRVLGQHRADDARSGWLSGLDAKEATAHPTIGGLRIGKSAPERRADEALDEEHEWDRDGQYFHYLTKWMHALDQVARFTRDAQYNLWARELAERAHAAFIYRPARRSGPLSMAWKMSVDLTRPLVSSMGQHDPLDGLLTCIQLGVTARMLEREPSGPLLERATADYASLLTTTRLETVDPLGLGGLLADAGRVSQLMATEAYLRSGSLLELLLAAAQEGLEIYTLGREWQEPAERRLAFRELGLAIGLSALKLLRNDAEAELREQLLSFWLTPEHQRSTTWAEHLDINEVMLATSLIPEGFLVLAPVAATDGPGLEAPRDDAP